MNVAIIGKSQINKTLELQLKQEGFVPFLIENIEEISKFSGEKLNFSICASNSNIDASYVVVTEDLFDDSCFGQNFTNIKSETPIVFLMDYPKEVPAYFTEKAIQKAISLVKRKKRVFFLSRSMRIAGNNIDKLYKEARNIGVTFIKYNDVSVELDSKSGEYTIEVTDDYDKIKIQTNAIIKADDIICAGSIDKIEKLFRLKSDFTRFSNDSFNFLFPTHTARNGVYFISSSAALAENDIMKFIKYTVSDIKSASDINCTEVERHAEIDEGKCAFCYTCFRACPHFAMTPDNDKSIMKNLKNACQACGICVSVCPADAIKISGEEKNEINSKKNIKILACENSGQIAADIIMKKHENILQKVDMTSMVCGGEISVEEILSDAANYEKVFVLVCADDACKHFEGNKRSERFVEKAREMLEKTGQDKDKITLIKLSLAMPNLIYEHIKEYI